MLVEKFTTKELRQFRKKLMDKFDAMCDGWLGAELRKMSIRQRRSANQIWKGLTVTVDKQKCYIGILCSTQKGAFFASIQTFIETSKGRVGVTFFTDDDLIMVTTPHYRKREKERLDFSSIYLVENEKVCSYLRHGCVYQLIVNNDAVKVTVDMGDNVRKYITVLHKDMCTGKHYQNLLKQLEDNTENSLLNDTIDAASIYEWE